MSRVEPENLMKEPLLPAAAFWDDRAGMALLMYEEIRKASDPESTVLDFLETTYQAGAKCAGWDLEALRLPAD